MIDEPAEHDSDDILSFNLELSDRELFSIGRIVALWGALEYEIFSQVLDRLNPASLSELPKAMNNIQPSQVLELWKLHIADAAEGKRKAVLQKLYEQITYLSNLRHAIVHGMWDWSAAEPEKIMVSRVRKDKLHEMHFTADVLGQFSLELGRINFRIRYPGGLEDYAAEAANQGSYMSRRFVAMTTDSVAADDWFLFAGMPTPEPSSKP